MSDFGWKDVPIGGLITEGGTARKFLTGDWKIDRPEIDLEKCVHCLRCWVYCPDMAVLVENEKIVGFDYDHCKGCGICAQVCPPKVAAITMVPAQADREEEK